MCDNEEVGALGIHLILLANIICSHSEGSYPSAEHAGFQPLMDDIHFSKHIHHLSYSACYLIFYEVTQISLKLISIRYFSMFLTISQKVKKYD